MVGFIKPVEYKGQPLSGWYSIHYKIDGVNATVVGGKFVSRGGKVLKGLEHLEVHPDREGEVYEVFAGDWETSITVAKKAGIESKHLYKLHPYVDSRLYVANVDSPEPHQIKAYLQEALGKGYEGIVVTNGSESYKVKPTETYDVLVTGVTEGKGRNLGRVGALTTDMGNVGTGLTDDLREDFYKRVKSGESIIIEVECMSLTPQGKFRHPRFKRERWDK